MSASRVFTTHTGVNLPRIVYGTAWKKERTALLVEQAISIGFRGIDTACQPKHYQEDLVGIGIRNAIAKHVVSREQLYIQTKFTPLSGHDPQRIPYDPRADIETQVQQSVEQSFRNLQIDYIDCIVIHSPMRTDQDTLRVWRVLERYVAAGKVKQLGLSNCYDIRTLRFVWDSAVHKPAVLQNRFYPDTGHDVELRAFCRERRIAYQSFWTLTGNPRVIGTEQFSRTAHALGLTPEQLMYRFVMDIGAVPLTGTTNVQHMQEALAVADAPPLSEPVVRSILALLPAVA